MLFSILFELKSSYWVPLQRFSSDNILTQNFEKKVTSLLLVEKRLFCV